MSSPATNLREADVRAAFAEWASSQAGALGDVTSLIEGVERSEDYVGFLSTDICGRRVFWKSVPANSRARITTSPIAITAVDPWTVEAEPLRERSDHIAVCDACGGERKQRCGACSGTGRTICGACGGQRKAYGYASNGAYRLLNCASCRGKGEIDCAHCRRGIASCASCAGEGRLQRWIEIEAWRRSVSSTHPPGAPSRFGWDSDAGNAVVIRDGDLVADIEKPHALGPADIGSIPAQWLNQLIPSLQPDERVVRQRFRIARIPSWTIHYRLGGDRDRATFTGRRLVAPPHGRRTAFARRASSLRVLRWLLVAVALIAVLFSLGRGTFYWSVLTLSSVLAFAAALCATYGAGADWTAARRRMRWWLLAAACFLVAALGFGYAALPRVAHAERLIAAARLDNAESELRALGDAAPPRAWAELRLTRIRKATDVRAARELLAQIPEDLPQFAVATSSIDELILGEAAVLAGRAEWPSAANALALLSERARGTSKAIAAAKAVYVPYAQQKVAAREWREAADVIAAARRAGLATWEIERLAAPIHAAGLDTATRAKRENDASRRLQLRLDGEAILMAWERATGNWGTPPLIGLRAAMARDVVAAERSARRRNS